MKKYEVKQFEFETKEKEDLILAWNEETNQNTKLIKSFDTPEEAKIFYESIELQKTKGCQGGYYHVYGKCIEENVYDEEGDWLDGGDWLEYEFSKI